MSFVGSEDGLMTAGSIRVEPAALFSNSLRHVLGFVIPLPPTIELNA